ncbi:MAG: phosphopyruvate hydratase, partial [Burkholderiales bacterium]
MARIVDVAARLVWDSRGRSTVEAEVAVKGARGRAIAPAGTSTGSGEAKSVETRVAVHSVNTEIRSLLLGKTLEQESVDRALIALDGTPDKSRLGGNAIVAVSLAAAHAAAAAARKPLWRFLAGKRQVAMPVPQIQIFGGGAHAHASMDLQDFMIVCIGAGSFAESLDWTAQVYRA